VLCLVACAAQRLQSAKDELIPIISIVIDNVVSDGCWHSHPFS